jgi:hypothetical protein
VNTSGQMEGTIMDNGKIICLMEKENTLGQMGEFMRVIILMTKKMDMEFTNGLMVAVIMGSGKIVKIMDRVYILIKKE